MPEDEFAEVGVDGDQDPALCRRQSKQIFVPRVLGGSEWTPNIVTVVAKGIREATPGTTVDQEPHWPLTGTASRRSPAMTA
jgi:hypothetical protein